MSTDGADVSDFFSWWAPGLNAEFFLKRALVQIWSQVRWRPPVNDSEKRVLKEVAEALTRAYKLDSKLDYPWAEWAEILVYLDADPAEREWVNSNVTTRESIGYRRGNVEVLLPGYWSLRVPGAFTDFEPDEEFDFFALDPPREIWFTSYSFAPDRLQESFNSMRNRIVAGGSEFVQQEENYVAGAKIRSKEKENGEAYFLLTSSNVFLNGSAVLNIVFEKPVEQQWALGVWRSLKPPPVRR
jgi:hypothetical protein